jgi:hypothetical protein
MKLGGNASSGKQDNPRNFGRVVERVEGNHELAKLWENPISEIPIWLA